ncbi:MAG TPA: DUF892 family protein [Croceibacterium sp.]
MSQSEPQKHKQKIVQYLKEARASERALERVLQSQIAMTPRGSYRNALETHLRETRDHAERVGRRLKELDSGSNPLMAVFGAIEIAAGQVLALGKTPFDLVRGSGGQEKALKNAKDAYATEALEIATYTALEHLARDAGDAQTADLAAALRADEERMQQRILRELPRLTAAVVRADVRGKPAYDVSETGAADAARDVGEATKTRARKAAAGAKRSARQTRKVPGVAQAERQAKGAVAGEGDLPIARNDSLTADEVTSRLRELSQIDRAKIDSYERRHQNRSTVLDRIGGLRGNEPWPGYDELTVNEIQSALSDGDDERAQQVRSYERDHKDRAGVVQAAERELSNA